MSLSWIGKIDLTFESATAESKKLYETVSDVMQSKRELFLEEFVSNEDLNVRRSLIPSLVLNEDRYPQPLKPLVTKAIELARSSSDDYIRHRVEVQLGNENSLKPLPDRN